MDDSGIVVRSLNDGDLPAALDLISDTWPEIPRNDHEEMVLRDPWRDDQRTFGAFVGDRLAAQARFFYRPVRIGRAQLRMIGVSVVATHPDFRRRGLGHRILKAALDWMRHSGKHFALLHTGVRDFYKPLGWGTVEQPVCCVKAKDIPALATGQYEISHVPIGQTPRELQGIYDRTCGSHPLCLARTPTYWASWPQWAAGNLWVGILGDNWTVARKDRRVVAYGAIQRSLQHDRAIGTIEACALPGHEEALLDIQDDLAARCRAAGGNPLELSLPGDHMLVTRLSPMGEWTTNSSVMVRIVDLPGLLEALRPELQQRAAALSRPARLRLESDIASAALAVSSTDVSVEETGEGPRVQMSPAGMGSLLLGFRSASDLAEAGEIAAEPAALELLNILFPCLHSHYGRIDRF